MKLHHTGYVVASIERSIPNFQRSLAAEWDGKIYYDPAQKSRVTLLKVGSQSPMVELVEPGGAESPVRAFLDKGGGIHHVCYEVASLAGEVEQARRRGGVVTCAPVPAVAFDGRRIAWVYYRNNLLVEYLEAAPECP